MGIMLVATWSISVIAVGLLTAVVSVGTSYIVDAADKKIGQSASNDKVNTDGIAAVIAPAMRKAGQALSDAWADLVKKYPLDYSECIF